MPWTLTGTRSAKLVQAASPPVPSGATDGVAIDTVSGLTVIAECDVGQTFTGTGMLEFQYYDPAVADWAYDPDMNLIFTDAMAGKRRIAFLGIKVHNPRGRVTWLRNALAVTAGNVTVYVAATNPFGRDI